MWGCGFHRHNCPHCRLVDQRKQNKRSLVLISRFWNLELAREENYMAKSEDAKKAEKKKPQKTAKEKKLAKQEKKKNK